MRSRLILSLVITSTLISGSACSAGRSLVSIQIVPADPNLAHNTTYYIAPGGAVQFMIQASYNDFTAQTLPASSGKWSSSDTDVAAVDNTGLATSAGPLGVTTVFVAADGHKASVILDVCNPAAVVCPAPPGP